MKSKEELNKLKEEVEAVNEKLQELTEEELAQVSGGRPRVIELPCEDPLWGVIPPLYKNRASEIKGEHDMSKTKEELDALKEEINSVNEKLKKLTPEELEQVNGGTKNPAILYRTQVAILAGATCQAELLEKYSQCN